MATPQQVDLTTSALRLEVAADASSFRVTSPGTPLQTRDGADFWTMSVEHGDLRDLTVRSSRQQGTVTRQQDRLEVRYANLIGDDGTDLGVELHLHIQAVGEELHVSASGRSIGATTVSEVTLPLVDLARGVSADRSADVLYRSTGLGQRTEDPWNALMRAHTEYFVDDQLGVWENNAYPGEFSMSWQGLASADKFLYLGRHDDAFRAVLFSAGVAPRLAAPALRLSVTSLAAARPGETFEVPTSVIALLEGDWRAGAARYRSWADSWYRGPVRHEKFRDIDGWQRVIMKHQFGQIYLRYRDLVDVFKQGQESGLRMILLFGWWKAGFDRGYPSYEPDERLGGADELRAAIEEIESLGGTVALYANGNLIDRKSDYYQHSEKGSQASRKDRSGLEYVVGYNFSSESRALAHFTGPDFTMGCHGSPTWRETMTGVATNNLTFGTASLFFDQTAYHQIAWPCYDDSHDHGPRVDRESGYRRATLANLRSAGSDVILGSEGMADCLIDTLDYHHGWGFAFQNEPEAFPFLFRAVYPEPKVSNRLIHDTRPDWAYQLHYGFVFNLIFDVAIYRCRATIDEFPEYAEKIAALTALRDTYRPFLQDGRFVAPDQSWQPGSVVQVEYVLGAERLTVTWNSSAEPLPHPETGALLDPNALDLSAGPTTA